VTFIGKVLVIVTVTGISSGLDSGLPDRKNICSQIHFKHNQTPQKIAKPLEMVATVPKHLIFSLEISCLQLFYFSPCILPESVWVKQFNILQLFLNNQFQHFAIISQ